MYWLQEQPLTTSNIKMSIAPPSSTAFPTLELSTSPGTAEQPYSAQNSGANYANASQEVQHQKQNFVGDSMDTEVFFLRLLNLSFQELGQVAKETSH